MPRWGQPEVGAGHRPGSHPAERLQGSHRVELHQAAGHSHHRNPKIKTHFMSCPETVLLCYKISPLISASESYILCQCVLGNFQYEYAPVCLMFRMVSVKYETYLHLKFVIIKQNA